MERCPNCRAREPGTPNCRRCGMELAGLEAVEAAAGRQVRGAMAQLAAGDDLAAGAALRQAYTLRRDPFIELLLGFLGHRRGETP